MGIIRDICRSWFDRTPIKSGQIYDFTYDRKNPFNKMDYRVEVKDVKDGYVLFKHLREGSIFQNESMKISSFRFCYKLIK